MTFKSAPTGVKLEEGRAADQAEQPGLVDELRAARRRSPADGARSRGETPGHRDPGPGDACSPLHAQPELAATRPKLDAPPGRGLRRARVGGLPRHDRGGHEGRRGQGEEVAATWPPPSARRPARPTRSSPLSRQYAIKYYTNLKTQYPKWVPDRAPPTPPRAQAAVTRIRLYYLAYEYEQANQLDDARQGVPGAHPELAPVEVHPQRLPRLRRASSSTRRRATRASGRWPSSRTPRSSRLPRCPRTRCGATPPTSSATSTGTRATSCAPSRSSKEDDRVRRAVRCRSPTPSSSRPRPAADMIDVYALAGDPKRAYDFIHPLSGDGGGTEEDVQS